MTTVQEDQVLAEMAWLTDRLLTHKHPMPNGLEVPAVTGWPTAAPLLPSIPNVRGRL
jgi:hypothetical protein